MKSTHWPEISRRTPPHRDWVAAAMAAAPVHGTQAHREQRKRGSHQPGISRGTPCHRGRVAAAMAAAPVHGTDARQEQRKRGSHRPAWGGIRVNRVRVRRSDPLLYIVPSPRLAAWWFWCVDSVLRQSPRAQLDGPYG